MRAGAGTGLGLLCAGAATVAAGFLLGSQTRAAIEARPALEAPEDLDAAGMQAALQAALLEPDTLERALALDALLRRLDADNVEGAAAALDPIVVGVGSCDLAAIVKQRAALDPEGAFEQALDWPNQERRKAGVNAASQVWAWEGAPLEALSYIDSIESEETRFAAIVGLVRGWSRSDDVAGVSRFLMQMPDDPDQSRNNILITTLVSDRLRSGSEHLISWFDDIDEDAPNGFKAAVFGSALLQLAARDPERAIGFYDAHAGRSYRTGTLWRIMIAWLNRGDPDAAMDWLLSRPADPDRKLAFIRGMEHWSTRDRRAAARWVAGADLEEEPGLRRLLYGITRQGRPPLARRPSA